MEAEKRPQGDWPLSFAQERLWFLNQLLPGCPVYHIPAAWRLRGPLDLTALKQSLSVLMERHEMLSTTIALVDGHPIQKCVQRATLPLTIEDLRAWSLVQRDAALDERLQAMIKRSFDLSQGPLWRIALFRLADEEYILLVIFHEVIADGWSVKVFERELVTLYSTFVQRGATLPLLPELPFHYTDFALRQRQNLQDEEQEALLAYWRQQLETAPHVLELPGDAARPAAQTFWSASHMFSLPGSLFQALQRLSQPADATPFMTLLAAFQVLLFRYTEQEALLVGTPISGRQAEVEGIVGPLANTLALRADLSGNPSFRELLARTRRTCIDAFAHQDLPFAQLVEAIQPERDLSRNPLVQVMFAFQAASQRSTPVWRMGEVEMLPMSVERGMTTADLSIILREEADGLVGTIEYNRDLFREETITRLAEHYCALLKGIAANPAQRISDLPMLTQAERHQLLVEWNKTQAAYPTTLLHRLFEAQVERTPDAVALVCAGDQLTYDALNRSANQVARALRSQGVGPEIPVGVLLERSPELMIGLLGILKAGGAYVPLDPSYPKERLAIMLADAQAPVLLTQTTLQASLPAYAGKVICLDADSQMMSQASPENLDSGTQPEHLAYVIYTSGSTGTPKGVMVTHSNVTRLFAATDAWYHFNERDVWTFFHSYAFDFSVWELWGALLYGGRVVVVPYLVSRSPEAFYKLLVRERVTVLNQTPSAFYQLIDLENAGLARGELSLRLVIFGGEALEIPKLKTWFDQHGDQQPQLVNMYGITETTVHVTYRPLTVADVNSDSGSVIGYPIPDLTIYVLDQHFQPLPIGIPGEMYVGGAGVARGYLNRPELTAERFIPDPFSALPGSWLYRTGDLARYHANGDIEYLGRIDHQVKLRGFRIELGEIEACLKRLPLVQEAIVILRRDHAENAQLVAYVVPKQKGGITPDELERDLLKDLPSYMMPAAFVLLAALPLSSNGKIDRRALPAPEIQREQVYVAPRNPTEELVAQIWMEVLGLSRVGIHENFFKLGGHSLLLMRVFSRLRVTFQIEMPLQRFMERPTIASLCEAIEEIILAEVADIPDEEAEQELSKLAWEKRST
ncbi:MAG TPA: amino acid adenylation domain-containing protein [Ktedonobacteraceae bacterium]|nr:amino acid adenylation domain-containing protein [Ktedonobacteraceae bacterium]